MRATGVWAMVCQLGVLSGCAGQGGSRFAVGKAEAALVAPERAEGLERVVSADVSADRVDLLICFNALADRLGSAPRQRVDLRVAITGGDAVLFEARSRSPETIIDADLVNCLRQAVGRWNVPAHERGEVMVPLEVWPRRSEYVLRAEVSASRDPAFKPEE